MEQMEELVEQDKLEQQVTLVVPPEERIPPGILNRIWHWLTFRKADEKNYVPEGKQ